MKERRFREDENELPYLVWETRDEHKSTDKGFIALKLDFEDIPFSEFPTYVKRLFLSPGKMEKIISSIDVIPDCTFSLHQKDNIIDITLVLKNEYVTSKFMGFFDSNTSELTFNYPYHDYSRLESMPWFENEIRRVENETGLKLDSKSGGYHFQFDDGKLKITDEFEILVYFSDGDFYSDSHSYKVDLKMRKLEKYHVHDWIELNAAFL